MVETAKWHGMRTVCAAIVLSVGCQRTLPVVSDDPAGSAGSAGSSAKTGSTSSGVQAGDKDKIVARAVADIAPFGMGKLSGQVTFEQTASGSVSGSSHITNCEEGKTYYMFVRDGKSCGSETDIGGHWSQDGDGAFTTCFQGVFDALAVRIAQPSRPSDWSIGGSSTTDLTGHAVIVTLDDDENDSADLGCGLIRKSN